MPDIKNYNDVYQYIADLEAENKKLKVGKFVWMAIVNILCDQLKEMRDQLDEVKGLEKKMDDLDRRITRLEEKERLRTFEAARSQEGNK